MIEPVLRVGDRIELRLRGDGEPYAIVAEERMKEEGWIERNDLGIAMKHQQKVKRILAGKEQNGLFFVRKVTVQTFGKGQGGCTVGRAVMRKPVSYPLRTKCPV